VQGDGLQMGCRPSKADNAAMSMYTLSETDSDYIRQTKLYHAGAAETRRKQQRWVNKAAKKRLCSHICLETSHTLRYNALVCISAVNDKIKG